MPCVGFLGPTGLESPFLQPICLSRIFHQMNIFSLKKKQREQQQINLKTKSSAAQIRIQKDFNDLQDLPKSMKITFPDPNNLFEFNLDIKPDDGYYKGGLFKFMVNISTEYPHQPPKVFSTKKVLCLQKIYHPNIDLEGNVCLNILREDWKPVLNLNAVLVEIINRLDCNIYF